MKVRILLVLGIGFTGAASLPAHLSVAEAEQVRSNQILITAVVPERRGVVVDTSGKITLFYSNTPNAVTPEVRLGSLQGPVIPMSQALDASYSKLASKISDNKVYEAKIVTGDPLKSAFPQFIASAPTGDVYQVRPSQYGPFKEALPYFISAR